MLLARRFFRGAAPLAVCAGCALAAAMLFRDFTVDDALIAVRYAANLADGFGWRFNRHGVPSDGVTPLPLPLLLWPFVRTDAVHAFERVRLLMGLAHVGTVIVLLRAVHERRPTALVWGILALSLLVAFPLAAYGACGLETPLAALLATAGSVSHASPRRAALLCGLAATLRPALAPWAATVAVGFTFERPLAPDGVRTVALALTLVIALALGPALLCVLVRALTFGSPVPLALEAKPSDVASGARYALAALLTTSAPILAFAPRAASRMGRPALTLLAALAVHVVVITLVGGDWMPFARLFAPVLPSLLYAFVLSAPFASVPWTIGRALVAFALGGVALATSPFELRHLLPQRLQLARMAAPYLAHADRVAALDIGWVTLATGAELVDLAGLTDAQIAALPGGHTSKHVDGAMLLGRRPDFVLLYTREAPVSPLATWRTWGYPRAVEARLARDDRFAEHATPVAFLPLGAAGYLLLAVRP